MFLHFDIFHYFFVLSLLRVCYMKEIVHYINTHYITVGSMCVYGKYKFPQMTLWTLLKCSCPPRK